MQAASDELAALAVESNSDPDDNDQDQIQDHENQNETSADPESKRKLSSNHTDDIITSEDSKRMKLYGDGTASSSSDVSPTMTPRAVILHASAPPRPSCPRRGSNVLYQHPPHVSDKLSLFSNNNGNHDSSHLPSADTVTTAPATGTMAAAAAAAAAAANPEPEWKKTHQFNHTSEDGSLPFSRSIVGTYSCHGIEPVYDSEDLHDVTLTSIAKINQDRGGVFFPYANCPRTAVFAAYDGHGEGGELVAQYALHEVSKRLEQHEEFKKWNIQQAFKDVFVSVNDDLTWVKGIEPLYSGCTACVALLRDNEIYCSNAGDSRAVLACRKDGVGGEIEYESFDLTTDQNPDSPGEKERILKAGGFVSPPPEVGLSSRVWLDAGFSQIGLAMGRSLGDHAVKTVGVIAEPVVTRHELREQDEFIIIATDGVWEFLSSQDAVDIVSKDLKNGGGSSLACQNLIEAAAAKWHEQEGDYRDDITALVIKVKELW